MGMMIDEEECPVCEVFDQEWIFTYGDLVTLLLCFFILLFSMCKVDVEKLKEVSMSFKAAPPGSPFIFSGKKSELEEASKEVEQLDMPDDVTVNVSEAGLEVSFKETALFEVGSTELTDKAKKALQKLLPIMNSLTNPVLVEGHTDNQNDQTDRYPSNWELSTARASAVATYLEQNEVKRERITVSGYGHYRPRVANDTAYKRKLNQRVNVFVLPEQGQ